jgi:chromosome segregation ATPase
MGTLDHVKILESKVVKAIDFVNRLTEENDQLKEQLDSYQKRIDELEALIQSFKEEQGRIEDGILSALNRLNQFEDAIDKSLSPLAASVSSSEFPSADILEAVEEILAPVEIPENSEITSDEILSSPTQEEQSSESETQPQ